MRQRETEHCESLRCRAAGIWDEEAERTYRPAVNVPMLLLALHDAAETSSNHNGKFKGKKRMASSSKPAGKKRPRTLRSEASGIPVVSQVEVEDEHDEEKHAYPLLPGDHIRSSRNIDPSGDKNSLFPVYCHTFKLFYTTDVPSRDDVRYAGDRTAQLLGWKQQEEELENTINALVDDSETTRYIDLGTFGIRRYKDRLVAVRPVSQSGDGMALRWFFLLPRIDWDAETHYDTHDYSHLLKNDDVLDSLFELQTLERTCLETRLRVYIPPSSEPTDVKGIMPFELHVEITAFLVPRIILDTPLKASTQQKTVRLRDLLRRVLTYVFPSNDPFVASRNSDITVPFFYSFLGPAPALVSEGIQELLQPKDLLPTLLPFQRRSVAWLLGREGKQITTAGTVELIPEVEREAPSMPLFWEKVGNVDDDELYFNHLSGVLMSTAPAHGHMYGGILAEEPGLGKTLECIAMILLNPASSRNPSVSTWDPEARLHVKEVKTTLIVTPASLAAQWADEIAAHAPTLKVFVYDGWHKLKIGGTHNEQKGSTQQFKVSSSPASKKGKGKASDSEYIPDNAMDVDDSGHLPPVTTIRVDSQDWCTFINDYDVCITTYNVLQQDLAVALPPPNRPRRATARYEELPKQRSPLIMCEWYRVIMDEVQMQGGGKTEEMVSLIPRLSSFAVSGTPARAQAHDLIHVLKFLRIYGDLVSPRLWNRILKPGNVHLFMKMFRDCTIRTMKSAVKDELTIPHQTRYLVSIELGKIEQHVYDRNVETALSELGLDARGVAVEESWQVDATVLRSWIRKLRGICTHPQVGQLQQKDRFNKSGVLKSMAEVLETMREQNWRNLMEDLRSKIQSLALRAQLLQHDEDSFNRYNEAYDLLSQAEREATALIADIRGAMAEHNEQGELLKKEAAEFKENLQSRNANGGTEASVKGKEKAIERDSSPSVFGTEEAEDRDLPKTPAGEAHAVKKRALQHRLREAYLVLHRVKFLLGDVCHVLGESHSVMETTSYEAAESIRRDLLKTTEGSASAAMASLSNDQMLKGLSVEALLLDVPYCEKGGILSSELLDEANNIVQTLLNEQSRLIWEWRSCLHQLLTRQLTSEGEEADGEEYARTLDTQGEAEAYLQAYASLLADHREVLSAERTLLAAHDAKEARTRKTKAATAAAAAEVENLQQVSEDVEKQPEHEVLFRDLTESRKTLLERFNGRAIKSIIIDLTAVSARVYNDNDPEKILVRDGITRLRRLTATRGALIEKFEADLVKLRRVFNERITYFRQLQEISDSVAEATWDSTVQLALQACISEQKILEAKINTNRARQRYLNHLSKNKETDEDDQERCCILCRYDFTRGFITQCAHVFCEQCMKIWLLRKEGKACPVCRVPIKSDQLQRFTIRDKTAEPSLPTNIMNGEPVPKSSRKIEYNMIDKKLFSEIEQMESRGSYGNKIQTLVRHLLYLKHTDSGSKSIVFSAWSDSLHIIQHALTHNGISCIRMDQVKGKDTNTAKRFQTDDTIQVLLLHGERENAGLNVTAASRVFLLESVVHHGFEIQAIARIDRMGQKKPTEVFCYYAEGTVERNILDMAARKGLSLYTKQNCVGSLDVSNFAVDSARSDGTAVRKQKNQKGDFIPSTEDMLAVLFPHLFEDIEYLLPEEYPEVALAGLVAGPSMYR